MSNRIGAIFSLRHSTNRQTLQYIFLRFPLNIFHQRIKGLTYLLRFRRYLVPKFLRKGRKYPKFFWIRRLVNPIYHGISRIRLL